MFISEGTVELNEGWLRLAVESDLRKYLARLFEKTYSLPKLQAPSNGAHITIANIYELSVIPTQKHEKYIGRTISFIVKFIPYYNGNAVWVDVDSKDILEIRGQLGLSSNYIPHLCLGYFHEGKLGRIKG